MKKEYRNSPQGKIKVKNYRIISRLDPKVKAREKESHDKWIEKNREHYNALSREWNKRNAEKINERRREAYQEQFSK